MAERLDRQMLTELEHLMEDGFGSLLEAYLKDSERRLFEVVEAWESRDLEALRRSAHSLKGSSSNIGAAELAERCGHLENLARDHRAEAVPAAMDEVRLELREVREALYELVAGL